MRIIKVDEFGDCSRSIQVSDHHFVVRKKDLSDSSNMQMEFVEASEIKIGDLMLVDTDSEW